MTADPAASWSGPARRPTTLRPVLTGLLVVLTVAGCVVSAADRDRQLLLVLAGPVVTLVVRAWPRRAPRPSWWIDATGVTTRTPVGSTTHVPAASYDALAVAPDPDVRRDRLVLVRAVDPHTVVHSVPLDRVGTAFTVCVALRRLGVEPLLPPAGAAAVAAGEQRLRAALAGPAPTPSAGASEALSDRRSGRAVAVRTVVGGLGLVLVAGLAAPVGATGAGRLGAALGVLLVTAALPRLARGRMVRASLRWEIGPGGLASTDADRGSWRAPRAQVGAVVLTTSERGGHGAPQQTSALVVDPAGVPLVELPLRSLDPAAIGSALLRHGVPVVHAGVQPWEVRGAISPPAGTP